MIIKKSWALAALIVALLMGATIGATLGSEDWTSDCVSSEALDLVNAHEDTLFSMQEYCGYIEANELTRW